MAVAVVDPYGVAKVLSAELEENDSGSEWSSGVPEDSFSSDEGEQDDEVDDTPKTPDTKVNDAEKSKETGNAGWAEAMAKVLNKKISSDKPTILLKNKERDVERKKEKQERLEQRKKLNKKREWEMMCRVKPDVVKDREVERNLQRVATRGVVQLFNAVRKHQTNVGEKIKEAGSSERKRAKLISSVSKRDFISVLRGMDGKEMEQNPERKSSSSRQNKPKSEDAPAWNILRDDYMMGASMKDWDKESEEENSAGGDSDIKQESESDSDR
ncbi:RRP15-like protein [Notechis scutatus]|uniref:RRP15-like protein n=1 Tax=Notechis scutatus TaxID=8663 RepID=A0A6J1V0I3_9SAUR|nr:RRP15-like protein [Notechis scutatus]